MFLDGMSVCALGGELMNSEEKQEVWVAVRVRRGFITDIRAYDDPAPARRTERRWRSRMNSDYDEGAVACVVVNTGRRTPRGASLLPPVPGLLVHHEPML